MLRYLEPTKGIFYHRFFQEENRSFRTKISNSLKTFYVVRNTKENVVLSLFKRRFYPG